MGNESRNCAWFPKGCIATAVLALSAISVFVQNEKPASVRTGEQLHSWS